MNMNRETILHKLRENKDRIGQFGVKKIGIFGSAVRDELKEKSDIDIVVEFERGKATFKNVGGLVDFLEELFGRRIDLLTPDGIESIRLKYIKDAIKKTVEYV